MLGGAFTLAALTAVTPAHAAQTLNRLAQAQGRYFGSAASTTHFSDSRYNSILGSEFGQITPENSMKWDTTEPSRGQFDFSRGQRIVDYAQQHGQIVRGHNLVWHSQLPNWVSSLPSGQVQAVMENHITKEVTAYKGDIYAWDVVNEPFNDNGGYRSDVFSQAMGNVGYIADALRTAHAADPNAKLYLNDYNIAGMGAKSDAMYNLVKTLKQQGVPIDGVGFETHLAIQYGFPANMRQNLQRFADLGVEVAVTELDVRMQLPRNSTKDAKQADYYRQVTEACLAVSGCVGITVWGFPDKYSWVPDTFDGQGSATLYDDDYQTKPAYDAVAEALGGTGDDGGDDGDDDGGDDGGGTGCTATYQVADQWGQGFVAMVTVTNDGGSALNGWTVSWTWSGNQRIVNGWNATVTQNGSSVTADNASYNGTVAPGSSTSFGFQASYSGSNGAPTPTCTAD